MASVCVFGVLFVFRFRRILANTLACFIVLRCFMGFCQINNEDQFDTFTLLVGIRSFSAIATLAVFLLLVSDMRNVFSECPVQ